MHHHTILRRLYATLAIETYIFKTVGGLGICFSLLGWKLGSHNANKHI